MQNLEIQSYIYCLEASNILANLSSPCEKHSCEIWRADMWKRPPFCIFFCRYVRCRRKRHYFSNCSSVACVQGHGCNEVLAVLRLLFLCLQLSCRVFDSRSSFLLFTFPNVVKARAFLMGQCCGVLGSFIEAQPEAHFTNPCHSVKLPVIKSFYVQNFQRGFCFLC